MTFTDQEQGTIIAALRLWQDRDTIYSGGRVAALQDVATNGGQFEELTEDQIDDLCDKVDSVK